MAVGLSFVQNLLPPLKPVGPVSTHTPSKESEKPGLEKGTREPRCFSLCCWGRFNRLQIKSQDNQFNLNFRYMTDIYFSITRFQAILGPTYTNNFPLFSWNLNYTEHPVLYLAPSARTPPLGVSAWAPAHPSPDLQGIQHLKIKTGYHTS